MSRILYIVLLLLLYPVSSHAQTRTVEIKGGEVYIDGQLRENAVEFAAVNARLDVPVSSSVLLEIDGRVLRISAEGVEELHASEGPVRVVSLTNDHVSLATGSPRETSFIVAQAEELRARAREMERIGVQLQSSRVPDHELFQMIETLRHSAMEAERVAQALPHFRVQGYLSDVREQNEELYNRLVREQRLEQESVLLSAEIRRLQGAEREARIEDLRARLEEIFRIKQENRQREIEELETRLHSMQKRLEKRQRYHDVIIERRLSELIGSEIETP